MACACESDICLQPAKRQQYYVCMDPWHPTMFQRLFSHQNYTFISTHLTFWQETPGVQSSRL